MLQVTYSTLIDGCVREGAVDTGKLLLTEMVSFGVKPNAVTYNTLLRAYASNDRADMKVNFSSWPSPHAPNQRCRILCVLRPSGTCFFALLYVSRGCLR